MKHRRAFVLAAAVLLLTSVCARARVVVRCDVSRRGVVQLSYDASSEAELVRGFALDITVDNGATIESVFDYKIGESTTADPGYGIFLGSSTTPVADLSGCPQDTLPGLGTYGITVSVSSLYAGEVNAPLPKDDLLKFSIDWRGGNTASVSISLNACRGGIIMEDFTPPEEIDLVGCTLTRGPRIYVDDTASGLNNGASWSDAFTFLQDALSRATSDPCVYEIQIAQGTYAPDTTADEPTGSGARDATFQLIDDVTLKGGYAGSGASSPDDRNIALYETVLSGDINVPGSTADNSYHVLTGSGVTLSAILDGVTITAGNADGSSPHYRGGGIYCSNGSPNISNCRIADNRAHNGGGMANYYNSHPRIVNCLFARNQVTGLGGAMRNYSNSNPDIVNCTFTDNRCVDDGGAIMNYSSSPTMTNCNFNGNHANDKAGAIYDRTSSGSTITNCTFTRNSAAYGGALYVWQNGATTLANSIFWDNEASYGDEIGCDNNSTIAINFCDVQDGGGGVSHDASSTIDWELGNIDADPLFADADGPGGQISTRDDNLRLSLGSPCIDAGDNDSVPADVADLDNDGNTTEHTPWDCDGRNRHTDGDCNDADVVDMGAHEFDWVTVGDFAGGCDVDLLDFAILQMHWLEANPAIDIAPLLDPDGVIDLKELFVLVQHWLAGEVPGKKR